MLVPRSIRFDSSDSNGREALCYKTPLLLRSVACGDCHSAALARDGRLFVWGDSAIDRSAFLAPQLQSQNQMLLLGEGDGRGDCIQQPQEVVLVDQSEIDSSLTQVI